MNSANKVIDAVINDRALLEELKPYLNDIRNATYNLNYGGGFRRNQRFIDKAIVIIDRSKGKECLCEYAFEDYGQSVESLERFGFIILSKRVEKERFMTIGEIECPLCHQKYVVEEEFTGWHMTSSRHRKLHT